MVRTDAPLPGVSIVTLFQQSAPTVLRMSKLYEAFLIILVV